MRDTDVETSKVGFIEIWTSILDEPRELTIEQAFLIFYSIVMNILDYFVTIIGITSGKVYETNPIFSNIMDYDFLMYGLKIGFSTGLILFIGYFGLRYSKHMYEGIRICLIIFAVLWTVVVINNLVMMIW